MSTRKTCTQMSTAAFFIRAPQQKHPRDPSVGEWISEAWSIHLIYGIAFVTHSIILMMGYLRTVRNAGLIDAPTWMNVLGEGSRKIRCWVIARL